MGPLFIIHKPLNVLFQRVCVMPMIICRGAGATEAEGAAAPVAQTVRGQQVTLFDKNLYLLFV